MKAIFVTTSKIGGENQGDFIYSTQVFNGLKKNIPTDLFSFEQKNNYLAVLLFFFIPMMWVRNFSLKLVFNLIKNRGKYDVIYIDHYRCSWVVILAYFINKRTYVFNHNLESSVYKSLFKSNDFTRLKRVVSFVEYIKVFLTELLVFRLICGLSSISNEDIPTWVKTKSIVLPPYSSKPYLIKGKPDRPTGIIIGSFHWRLKQYNLKIFLDSFYEVYKKSPKNCSIVVAGSAPSEFFSSIQNEYPFLSVIDGFNDLSDLGGIATIGICPDQAGGGFKLKTLDYYKLNLPMIAIENGASGLLEPVVPTFKTFQDLAKEVYSLLDDVNQEHDLFFKQKSYFLKYHSEDAFLCKIRVFSEQQELVND